ncbi:hypothetical protein NQ317_003003 [Molorchus minor]|uniref:Uncharacterized protein n=1 Tax=Molorchus minor TaxID=1323400 RepID=A0ABQ9JLZ2_9CUCU|nr:hypothetical protein NQ317_003003 [Molorchus minor]
MKSLKNDNFSALQQYILEVMADNEELGLSEDHIDTFDETNGMHDEALLNDTDGDGTATDDPELEAIKARVREMEEEA